jgi:hypothetical protein
MDVVLGGDDPDDRFKIKLFPTSGRGIIVHFAVLGVVGESVSAYICYSVSFCW